MPLIITSLGAVADLVDAVHGYGGVVFHDVTTVRHGRKAAGAGVDGLILVCAGAGGHAGIASPFALVPEIRQFFDGTILLAGSISDGRGIAAAEMMGADMAYLGTRFINTKESLVKDANRQMIIDAAAADIVYTPAISGIPANFLRESLVKAGLDPDNLPVKKEINMGEELDAESRAWKDIWSAGQGVGSIDDVPSAAELCQRLKQEYEATPSPAWRASWRPPPSRPYSAASARRVCDQIDPAVADRIRERRRRVDMGCDLLVRPAEEIGMGRPCLRRCGANPALDNLGAHLQMALKAISRTRRRGRPGWPRSPRSSAAPRRRVDRTYRRAIA